MDMTTKLCNARLSHSRLFVTDCTRLGGRYSRLHFSAAERWLGWCITHQKLACCKLSPISSPDKVDVTWNGLPENRCPCAPMNATVVASQSASLLPPTLTTTARCPPPITSNGMRTSASSGVQKNPVFKIARRRRHKGLSLAEEIFFYRRQSFRIFSEYRAGCGWPCIARDGDVIMLT